MVRDVLSQFHKQRFKALQEFQISLFIRDQPQILDKLEYSDVSVMRMCAIQPLIMGTYISEILYPSIYFIKLYRGNLFPMLM